MNLTASSSALRHLMRFNLYRSVTTSINKAEANESAKIHLKDMPCVILVEPFVSENVGSISRSMLNFGMTDLRVVNPQCDITIENESAVKLAAGSPVLNHITVYSSLQDALADGDIQRVMATTVRSRTATQVVMTPQQAARSIYNHSDNFPSKTALVFGRERSGLINKEVSLADTIITVPTLEDYSSLNLAQSVAIICSHFWNEQIDRDVAKKKGNTKGILKGSSSEKATRTQLTLFLKRLQIYLDERKYNQHADIARQNTTHRNIQQIFIRTQMSNSEVDLMHGVLSSLIGNKDSNDKTK